MKDVITNRGLLSGAAVGVGVGLAIALLSGANKATTIIVFSVIGGFSGYSSDRTTSSFVGGDRKIGFRTPPQQGG